MLGLLLLAPLLLASVIFDDGFDSGTGAWFTGGTGGTLEHASGQLS